MGEIDDYNLGLIIGTVKESPAESEARLSLFEEGIEKTVRWYLENQEWMDNITSGEYEKYYESMYGDK